MTAGSPPHTWGIPPSDGRSNQQVRITPTHVGNTILSWKDLVPEEDHPHTRGEYSDDDNATEHGFRITPTHVGNTLKKRRHTGIPKFSKPGFQ